MCQSLFSTTSSCFSHCPRRLSTISPAWRKIGISSAMSTKGWNPLEGGSWTNGVWPKFIRTLTAPETQMQGTQRARCLSASAAASLASPLELEFGGVSCGARRPGSRKSSCHSRPLTDTFTEPRCMLTPTHTTSRTFHAAWHARDAPAINAEPPFSSTASAPALSPLPPPPPEPEPEPEPEPLVDCTRWRGDFFVLVGMIGELPVRRWPGRAAGRSPDVHKTIVICVPVTKTKLGAGECVVKKWNEQPTAHKNSVYINTFTASFALATPTHRPFYHAECLQIVQSTKEQGVRISESTIAAVLEVRPSSEPSKGQSKCKE